MLFQTVCKSSLAAAFALLVAGCTSTPKPPAPAPAPTQVPASVSPPAPRVLPVEAEPEAPASRSSFAPSGNPTPIALMLGYSDKVRALNGNDLSAEINRLGDPGDSPTMQMQLALALAQTRVPADLARAAGLMQRVAANPVAEAQALQPLARTLIARYLEQRRVEDDRDRQASQLRDAQRRIDQLNDRMEALRAIERSFNRPSTSAAPAPAPAPAATTPAGNGAKPAP